MAALTIRFKKRKDSEVTLSFVRADGSFTQDTIGTAKGFGPVHDLAHYAVESTMGIARGFLGLIAEGWTVQDFAKDGKNRIPNDAAWAEAMAGALSFEVMAGQPMGFDEERVARLEAELPTSPAQPFVPPRVRPEDFEAMRAGLMKLVESWWMVPEGQSLELLFEPGRRVNVTAEVEPHFV